MDENNESTETRLARILTFRSPDKTSELEEAGSAAEPRILPGTNFEHSYDVIAKQLLTSAKAWTETSEALVRELQTMIEEAEQRGVHVAHGGVLGRVSARCQRASQFHQIIEQVLGLLREKPDGFVERMEMAMEQWAKTEKPHEWEL